MSYKAYKENNIYGIFSSKENAEQALKDGFIDRFEKVPEQVRGYDGNFYDAGGEPEIPLHILKLTKKEEINSAYENEVQTVCNDAPQTEKSTWTIQATEAYAWDKDKNASTPCLDIIAKERGVERIGLLERALEKSKIYEEFCFKATGKRQRLEDLILSAQNKEELEVIKW